MAPTPAHRFPRGPNPARRNAIRVATLDTVFDSLPVGVAVVDDQRRIVMMNRAFHDSLGLPPAAFQPGTPVEQAVRVMASRGARGPGGPLARALLGGDQGRSGGPRRHSFAERGFDLYNTPLADGWYVVTALETTAPAAARANADTSGTQTASALSTPRLGLAVFNAQGMLLLSNPRFAALLGLPSDRVMPGIGFDSILDVMATGDEYATTDGTGFVASLRVASRTGEWTSRYRRGTGQMIEVMFDPLPDGGFSLTVNDITARATAEEDSRRRARLLSSVLEAVPHGICVYGADRRVAVMNQTYIDVMDAADIRPGDRLADIQDRRAASGEYEGDPAAADLAETIKAIDVSRPHMWRRQRPNGTAIDVRIAPLPDGGHISVVTDMTALTRAEAELRRRAEEMTVMLGNIRHGIVLWGADKRLIASNPAVVRLLGIDNVTLVPGQPESEMIDTLLANGHFGSGQAALEAARKLTSLDRALPSRRERTTRSGRVLQVVSNPTPGGGWITTYTDVTHMRETERELRRAKELAEAANQAKSRFLATMSHELRTPLNAIIGFSEALSREAAGLPSGEVADFGGQIHAAGQQLLMLINLILDVTRIETGRFESDNGLVDVADVVRAAVRQTESAAMAAGVSVAVDIAGRLPGLHADRRRLSQVLMHLLSNALKFTRAGGSVTVRAGTAAEHEVFVSVTDTGIGIAEAELERVFEPFTQVDDGLSRRHSGAGLGLYMARAIVAAHAGRLQLTSQPGLGTTVVVTLPVESRGLPESES